MNEKVVGWIILILIVTSISTLLIYYGVQSVKDFNKCESICEETGGFIRESYSKYCECVTEDGDLKYIKRED